METSDWIAIGAGLIALLALGASIAALWKTHFAKFSTVLTVGQCSFRIYPIKSEGEEWYIPSLDVPISFTNEGAQVGKVEDARIRVTFPEIPIPGHYEMFYAKWIVDGRKITRHRFDWIKKAVNQDWMPFVLLPKETKTKHIVFEPGRWDEPIIQNKMQCELEVRLVGKDSWDKIVTWTHGLQPDVWSELVEVGTSFCCHPDSLHSERDYVNPSDLHKYTGTKDEIPKGGFKSAPSYMNYPEEESKE